jgi:hypothetical protein
VPGNSRVSAKVRTQFSLQSTSNAEFGAIPVFPVSRIRVRDACAELAPPPTSPSRRVPRGGLLKPLLPRTAEKGDDLVLGHAGSASPYGTFDQGGNAYEWNETLGPVELHRLCSDRTRCRGIIGGSLPPRRSGWRLSSDFRLATLEDASLGFRVVMVPAQHRPPRARGPARPRRLAQGGRLALPRPSLPGSLSPPLCVPIIRPH